MDTSDATVERILADLGDGDASAAERLFPIVYDELRRLAEGQLQRERPGHTLQPTALVHEAYLRLAGQKAASWKGRGHFVAVATEAIRRVLIDHARKRGAQRRGGEWERVTLSGVGLLPAASSFDLMTLDDALQRLESLNPRHYEVAKLRYFGGLSGEQIALVLGIDRATVVRDWATARAWLSSELERGRAEPGGN